MMNMDLKKQKKWFEEAYDLGEKRLDAGYGWPLTVDPQLTKFLKIIKKSTSKGKALDIGCGQGRHTILFAENSFDSYGIDYIEMAIKEAKIEAKSRNLKNIYFKVMDLFSLDFRNNFFDVVLDWSVLDHIESKNWDKYLKNILKVLKVGGFLILTEFSANDKRIKDKTKNFYYHDKQYDHFFREDEIRKLFSKNFDIIEINETILKQPPIFLMINVLMRRK